MNTDLPSFDEVSEVPVTTSLRVSPEHIDANGHMNVRHYYSCVIDAIATQYESLGVGPSQIQNESLSTFNVEQHLRYLGELRLGDEITVHIRLVGRSRRSLHSVAMVLNKTKGTLAATVETISVQVNVNTRRTAAFPDAVAMTLDSVIGEDARYAWAAPICGAMATRN